MIKIPTSFEYFDAKDASVGEIMNEYTCLHLDAAIKEWTEYIFRCSIEKEAPMNYIDWIKNYKLRNKLIGQ